MTGKITLVSVRWSVIGELKKSRDAQVQATYRLGRLLLGRRLLDDGLLDLRCGRLLLGGGLLRGHCKSRVRGGWWVAERFGSRSISVVACGQSN